MFDEEKVTFKWRDSRNNNQPKLMSLETHEFIRRYLSHILPHGFMRVRYFGFLANAVKAKNIALIRNLLSTDDAQSAATESPISKSAPEAEILALDKKIANLSQVDLKFKQSQVCALSTSEIKINDTAITASTAKSKAESIAELMKRVVGIDITLCKHCKLGRLEKIQTILPGSLFLPTLLDTS